MSKKGQNIADAMNLSVLATNFVMMHTLVTIVLMMVLVWGMEIVIHNPFLQTLTDIVNHLEIKSVSFHHCIVYQLILAFGFLCFLF